MGGCHMPSFTLGEEGYCWEKNDFKIINSFG